jgi:hypothetical protein
MYYLIICFPCLHSTSLHLSVTLVFNDTPTMKFATLVIFACLKCVTVKSQGSLRVEDKSSNKAATAVELTEVYDPEINDDAIVNADERAEADWGLKSSVREAMVCTPLWYINCDGVCVMSCEVDIGGSCGGLAKPWDTLCVTKSECCEKKLTSIGVPFYEEQLFRDSCLASCHSPTPAPNNASSKNPSTNPSSNPSEFTITAIQESTDPSSNPSSLPSSNPSSGSSTNPSSNNSTSRIPSPIFWVQKGSAMVGDAAKDNLGNSVALSADAKTMVTGAPGFYYNPDREGYVKVYHMTNNSGSRTQLGQTIYGNVIGDRFGYSVDITAESNRIVVGSPGDQEYKDRPGYVQVYSLDSDGEAGTTGAWNWKQVGQDIAGEVIGDEFGYSVSISDDGKMIAVGAPSNDGTNGVNSGHVRIYRLADDGARWEQIGEDIDGDAATEKLGTSVSLSANGSIIAIGVPFARINGVWTGQVKVYTIDSGGLSWEQLGKSIYGDNDWDQFGRSVDISPDGNSLAVGTWVNTGPGYVKVFSMENGGGEDLGAANWKQIAWNITGEGSGGYIGFGYSVSLSDDAKTLAIGAPWANDLDSGYVQVYRMDDSELGWTQIGEDIDGKAFENYSGWSVSLSADGKTVAIGSGHSDDNGDESGHVRVFVCSGCLP